MKSFIVHTAHCQPVAESEALACEPQGGLNACSKY